MSRPYYKLHYIVEIDPQQDDGNLWWYHDDKNWISNLNDISGSASNCWDSLYSGNRRFTDAIEVAKKLTKLGYTAIITRRWSHRGSPREMNFIMRLEK